MRDFDGDDHESSRVLDACYLDPITLECLDKVPVIQSNRICYKPEALARWVETRRGVTPITDPNRNVLTMEDVDMINKIARGERALRDFDAAVMLNEPQCVFSAIEVWWRDGGAHYEILKLRAIEFLRAERHVFLASMFKSEDIAVVFRILSKTASFRFFMKACRQEMMGRRESIPEVVQSFLEREGGTGRGPILALTREFTDISISRNVFVCLMKTNNIRVLEDIAKSHLADSENLDMKRTLFTEFPNIVDTPGHNAEMLKYVISDEEFTSYDADTLMGNILTSSATSKLKREFIKIIRETGDDVTPIRSLSVLEICVHARTPEHLFFELFPEIKGYDYVLFGSLMSGHFDVVRVLLKNGVRLGMNEAFEKACEKQHPNAGDLRIIEMLTNAGARLPDKTNSQSTVSDALMAQHRALTTFDIDAVLSDPSSWRVLL